MRFPAKKNAATHVTHKHRAISRQENMALATPGRVVVGLPSPSPSLRAGSRLGFMREMRDASGEAARAWGEVGGAGRRDSLLLLL